MLLLLFNFYIKLSGRIIYSSSLHFFHFGKLKILIFTQTAKGFPFLYFYYCTPLSLIHRDNFNHAVLNHTRSAENYKVLSAGAAGLPFCRTDKIT